MSEDRTVIKIRLNGKKIDVAMPEFSNIDDLLGETGAERVRSVTPMNRFYEENGVEKVESDPIVGPWQRKGRLTSGGIGYYELHAADPEKLKDFVERYRI